MSPEGLRKGEMLVFDGFRAEVQHTYGGGVWVTVGANGRVFIDDAAYAALAVTRQAPAVPTQWPPKLADVWEAGDGQRWVAVAHDEFEDGLALMRLDALTRRTYYAPNQWIDGYGPATLAYRIGYEMLGGEPHPPLTDKQHAELLAKLRSHGNVGPGVPASLAEACADEPGGWMRPGEHGSVYVKKLDVATDASEIDVVDPSEIVDGDTIHIPGVSVDVVVDDHESTYAGTTSFFYERDGREHEHVVHRGGAVARVRKAGESR